MRKFARQVMMASVLVTVLTMTWTLPIARADETDAPAPTAEEVTTVETAAPEPEPAAPTEPEAPVAEASESEEASAPAATPSEPSVFLETTAPELTTDKPDYQPGEYVSIFGRFFAALADIVLTVFGDSETGDHYFESTSILKTDSLGSFATGLLLDNMYRPFYTMVAKSLSGELLATSTFTDAAPAAGNLDQCSNGSLASPNPCTGSAWQNGNLNSNQAHYVEGDSAPYRMVLTGLPTTGVNTLVIEYDIKHSSKHAVDFLTSFNRTETTANPCSGVSPCLLSDTEAVPAPSSTGSPVAGQPTTAFNALPAAERAISVYNGAVAGTGITYVSQGNLTAAQSATRVMIQFTASSETVVFAWGGHIGSSNYWGAGQSAGGISGSPYHMRFIELNGKGGNQDRSLSAGAIAPPPQGALSGVKFHDLNGNGVKDPSDVGLSGWTITLSGAATGTAVTDADGNYAFGGLVDGSYTLCETMQSGWTQTFPASGTSCSGGTKGYTVAIADDAVVGGKDFGNTQFGTITVDKVTAPSGDGQSFSFTLSGPTAGAAALTDASAPNVWTGRAPGAYTLTEASVSGWTLTGASCTGVATTPVSGGVSFTLAAGQSPVCTFTNTKAATLTVIKVVTNDDGGVKTVSDFPLFIDGGSVASGAANVVSAGAHTVSETQQTGYAMSSISGDCAANGSVSLAPGENKTCTITNDDIRPKLTLTKIVTNDDGGTKLVSDFALDVSGTPVVSGAQNGFAAGVYQASETNLAGYAASSWSGDCAANGSVTLAVGEVKSCTITNNDIAPTLTLVKTVVNDDGGSLTVAQVPLFIDGNAATSGVAATLSAGNHAASETNPAGYTASAWGGDCAANGAVSLAPGENKTCTITNNDIAPRLTLVKTVVNDDGGSLTVAQVPLFIDGNAAVSGVTQTLAVGVHTASETNPAGYTASVWGGDCAANGSVTLLPGDVKICTITNDDIRPKLTLVKTVTNDDGGSLTVAQVPLFIDGNAATSGVAQTLAVGAHAASETNPAGYTASAWGGDCAANGSITLSPGDDKTCTITNDDIAPKLTLIKTVTNDDGGTLTVGQVPLFIDGNAATSGVAQTLAVGAHTASETNAAGYTASAWGGDCAADGSITLNPGDDKACTITNDDIAPRLTLVKRVVNDDGGSLEVEDVALFIDGDAVASGIAETLEAGAHAASETNVPGYAASVWGGDCDAQGNISLLPGDVKICTITNDDIAPKLTLVKIVTNDDGGILTVGQVPLFIDGDAAISGVAQTLAVGAHTASETNAAGYAASAWGGDCAADGSITLNPGDDKTCVITNDDIAPKLTLIKTVTNDDGGTLEVEDVALFIDGSSVTSGVAETLEAGSYVASETNVAGYAASSWGGDCAADGSVSLAPGENKTCTITNDDIRPKLTLTKIVTNDDGGTKLVSDFTLDVSGTPVVSGAQNGFAAGAYQASETNLVGYAASSWSGDCAANGSVTLAVGDVKSCTITNNDIAPKLTLVKTILNDDGGSLQVGAVALFVDGNSVTSGAASTLMAGAHAASETNPVGYLASQWGGDCAADGSIVLNPGDDKTCTIVNDDIAPRLTLVKTVTNDDGGTLAVSDFALFVDNSSATSGVPKILLSGVHTASETNVAGYAASSWGGDCAADGSITLNPGDVKTCTIVNDDIRPKLTLNKIVVNDDGGTLTASDFALDVSGTPVVSGAQNGFVAGAYQASETNAAGYAASSWSGDCAADGSVTLAVGDVKNCTITNDDIPGEIRGMKFEDLDGDGVKDAGEPGLANWTINLSNGATTVTAANGAYAFTGLDAGSYTVTETQKAGWTQTTAAPSPILLSLGQVATGVDFGNFRLGRVTGHKWHDADMSALKDNGESNLAGWTVFVDANANGALDLGEASAVTTLSGYTLTGLAAGTYSICEVGQSGWSQVFPANGACHAVTISTSGQTVSGINFGNVNEREGTIGLWRNWNKHNKYTQTQIDGWLAGIDAASAWLMTEAGYPATTVGMVSLINDATKYCSQFPDKIECSKRKFLAQYMVNRLNLASGRKSLTSTYDLSSFGGAMAYLGISPTTSVTLGQYISKVEAKAATTPNRNQFMQMMSVSDKINNTGL